MSVDTSVGSVSLDSAAHRMLRRAYEASYRFPEGFGGFSAALYYAWDTESRSGTVEVRSPSDIRITGSVEDADGRLRRELSSIVGHRWPLSYDEADGRHRLSLDPEEHPLGTLVRVEDDGMDSTYRIQGGHIQQIERSVGGKRFSINIQERNHTGDGRALPAHFCTIYWETNGDATAKRLVRTDIYRDKYMPVGGVYLPPKPVRGNRRRLRHQHLAGHASQPPAPGEQERREQTRRGERNGERRGE